MMLFTSLYSLGQVVEDVAHEFDLLCVQLCTCKTAQDGHILQHFSVYTCRVLREQHLLVRRTFVSLHVRVCITGAIGGEDTLTFLEHSGFCAMMK